MFIKLYSLLSHFNQSPTTLEQRSEEKKTRTGESKNQPKINPSHSTHKIWFFKDNQNYRKLNLSM